MAPNGRKVSLSEDYWRHILFRHPEVLRYEETILKTVEEPDEIYVDERGGIHSIKRIDKDHFLAVIYELEKDEDSLERRTSSVKEGKRGGITSYVP